MKTSVCIVCSVAADDVAAANVIAAQMDYEPESLGFFFSGYNSTGDEADPVELYVDGLHVRPEVRAAIEQLIADGGAPESFKLHAVDTVADAMIDLGVVEWVSST